MAEPMSFDEPTGEADRDEILTILAQNIHTIHTQLDTMEWETPEEQELAIKWIRALGYLSGQYRMLKKDTDIDEMESELDLLKTVEEVSDG